MRKWVVILGLILAAWLAFSWGLMIMTEIAHRHWWALVPGMGYVTALALIGLSMIMGGISGILQAALKEAAR